MQASVSNQIETDEKVTDNPQQRYAWTTLTLAHMLCVHALLLAKVSSTQLPDDRGQPTAADLSRALSHASPVPVSPAAPPNAGYPALSSPASVPIEILKSAKQGEHQKVAKWLREGGGGPVVDALSSTEIVDGVTTRASLLHIAAANGHLEIVRQLLRQGASVDVQTDVGVTALMITAGYCHPTVIRVLLQSSAETDLQARNGQTALMVAASQGQEACVKALLQARANTELTDVDGNTALHTALQAGHTAAAKLIQQHASCLSLNLGGWTLCAEWTSLSLRSMVLRAIAIVCFGVASYQAAWPNAAEELLAKEEAKGQVHSKRPKKKREAPSAATPASLPKAKAKAGATSAAARAEAALRAAIEGGGLSALEAALAAAPRGVWESGVGKSARARYDKLLSEAKLEEAERQQEAEREANQEAARLAAAAAAAERAQEAEARDAECKAKLEGPVEAAAAAAETTCTAVEAATAAKAEANTLDQATVEDGEGDSSRAVDPSEVSGAAAGVPDDYMCPITTEIMADPVCTADGFTYEREAISEWLCTRDTSPLTGVRLESKKMIPNIILRRIIRRYVEAG